MEINEVKERDEIVNQEKLIGRFIVRFEGICVAMRVIILYITYPDHNIKQRNIIETLLAKMSASDLCDKVRSLIHDNFPDEEELKKVCNVLSTKFNEMMEVRNTIVHGSILMCRANLEGEYGLDSFLLKKPKTTGEGLDPNARIVSVDKMKQLIDQLNKINLSYNLINALTDGLNHRNSDIILKQLKSFKESIGKISLD